MALPVPHELARLAGRVLAATQDLQDRLEHNTGEANDPAAVAPSRRADDVLAEIGTAVERLILEANIQRNVVAYTLERVGREEEEARASAVALDRRRRDDPAAVVRKARAQSLHREAEQLATELAETDQQAGEIRDLLETVRSQREALARAIATLNRGLGMAERLAALTGLDATRQRWRSEIHGLTDRVEPADAETEAADGYIVVARGGRRGTPARDVAAVHRQLARLRPHIMAGVVEGETLASAEALAVTADELTGTREGQLTAADAWDWLGRARELSRDPAVALTAADAWLRAASWWSRAGAPEAARRAQASIARGRLFRSGVIDAELVRLVQVLRDPDAGALRRGEALLELGQLQLRSGDPDEAVRALHQATTALSDVPPDVEPHLLQFRIDRELALVSGDGSVLAAARAHRQAADDLIAALTDTRQGPGPIDKLADDLDDWDVAALRDPADPGLRERAERLLARWSVETLEPAADVAAAIARRLADLHSRRGDAKSAAAVLRVAVSRVPQRRRHDLGMALEVRLARAEATLGDWPGAEAAATRALGVIEPLRAAVTGVRPREGYTGERIDAYLVAAEAALRRADVGRFVEVTDLLKSHSLGPAEPQNQPAELVGWIKGMRAEGREPDLRGEEAPADRWLRRLARDAWDAGRRGPARRPFDLLGLRQSLAVEEAVLSYFWLDAGRLVVVVARTHDVWYDTVVIDAADRARLEEVASAGGPGAIRNAGALGSLLLPPTAVLSGVRRLYVSPHRLLHAVPFAALRFDDRPLIEACSVVMTPSLSVLNRPRAESSTGSLAGVDIAEFWADSALPSLDVVAGPARASYETWRALGRLGPTLSDKAASVTEVLARAPALARADVLQLVTHGTNPRPQDAVDARLALADGVIDDLDLAMWPFNGALVIMFACYSSQRAVRSESGAELVADEINGLGAALFSAGAGAVLGALWPAQAAFVAALIGPLHRELLAGRPPDAALRAALCEVRGRRPMFDHPYNWAPYTLTTTTLLPLEDLS